VYFLDEWLVEYDAHELPLREDLRFFGASDHAVSEKQNRDYTVLGCVAIDRDDNIWLLPDIVWERMETDRTVEELLIQFRANRPGLWWMENELISKSFGPFLKQRMLEERVSTTLSPVTPTKDKQTRARAIQGRMAMKKIRFPRFAPWWGRAKAQLLRFPNAANDDFVDFLSHIGQGLLRLQGPGVAVPEEENVVQVGSIKWILAQSRRKAAADDRRKATAGW
jgi:predicted phage terminase large subunit-like protein